MGSVPLVGEVSFSLGVASSTFTVVDKSATLSQSGTGILSVAVQGAPTGTMCPYTLTAAATKI
jgi:hypothetical protein